MIAKYSGPCRYCGVSVVPGRDQYDLEAKNSYHESCVPLEPGFISCPTIRDPLAWCTANGWIAFDLEDYARNRKN